MYTKKLLVALLVAAFAIMSFPYTSDAVDPCASSKVDTITELVWTNGGRVDWLVYYENNEEISKIVFDSKTQYQHLDNNWVFDVKEMDDNGSNGSCWTCGMRGEEGDLGDEMWDAGMPDADPDGDYIVFVATEEEAAGEPGSGYLYDMWVLSRTNSPTATKLLDCTHSTSFGLLHPHFNDSTSEIYWSEFHKDGQQNLYLQLYTAQFNAGSPPYLSSVTPHNPTTGDGKFQEPGSYDPNDNDKFLFTANGDTMKNYCQCEIYLHDTDGGGSTTQIVDDGEAENMDEHAHYSPATGEAIIWMSSRDQSCEYSAPDTTVEADYWMKEDSGDTRLTCHNADAPDRDLLYWDYAKTNSCDRVTAGDLSWHEDGDQFVGYVQCWEEISNVWYKRDKIVRYDLDAVY